MERLHNDIMEVPVPYETLPAQIKAVLLRYTKSSRLDEIVAEIMQAIIRDAPKVEIHIPVDACSHMYQLIKNSSGVKQLVCKHCKNISPIS